MRQVEVQREEPLQHVDILIEGIVHCCSCECREQLCAGLCWPCPSHYMVYWGVQEWDKYCSLFCPNSYRARVTSVNHSAVHLFNISVLVESGSLSFLAFLSLAFW